MRQPLNQNRAQRCPPGFHQVAVDRACAPGRAGRRATDRAAARPMETQTISAAGRQDPRREHVGHRARPIQPPRMDSTHRTTSGPPCSARL